MYSFQKENADHQEPHSKKRKLTSSQHGTPLVTISDPSHSAANTVMVWHNAVAVAHVASMSRIV